MRSEDTKMRRKKIFMCTQQNCTCWFHFEGDLKEHQKREH